ncbi:uncharacterized protein ARMOST_15426 [Armillaria ostoyae]|uniref:Uncharacterized protein n=1 Tax=Armillaria ostoyae TaxID=47428 RepID=A0A284RTG5_ARMOS|nr:uncharacterized protein ARMOST_15426 [Armillaria ostoyae]
MSSQKVKESVLPEIRTSPEFAGDDVLSLLGGGLTYCVASSFADEKIGPSAPPKSHQLSLDDDQVFIALLQAPQGLLLAQRHLLRWRRSELTGVIRAFLTTRIGPVQVCIEMQGRKDVHEVPHFGSDRYIRAISGIFP